jgi:hypothetical protein
LPAILAPARRQVNAKGPLRELHAAEEGLEAGVGEFEARFYLGVLTLLPWAVGAAVPIQNSDPA